MPDRLTISALSNNPEPRGNPWYYDSQLLIFGCLLIFRIINAFSIKTFFQPDEYFQSLEPAWDAAFGPESGAWTTWEWREQLRSSIHPWIFASVYGFVYRVSRSLDLGHPYQAELLVAAPKILQACFAAVMDFCTARLALRTYGGRSRAPLAALLLTVCSPWQCFCSTRTLSNSLETTLTIYALDKWPWQWAIGEQNRVERAHPASDTVPSGLEVSLLASALACILRPTNFIIWVTVGLCSLLHCPSWQKTTTLAGRALLCGSAVLAFSIGMDRKYYGDWVLPPLKFLHFNLVQELAVFYGKNRPDYYLTEGLPLLLTTALPFAAIGMWQSLRRKTRNSTTQQQNTLFTFALTIPITVATLSLISHKEVRFIYPLLPLLHILAASPLTTFSQPYSKLRPTLLLLALLTNLTLAFYATQIHQRGVLDLTTHLRHLHSSQPNPDTTRSVGFLMPCHSTPWRSHLVHAGLEAWALTCEPPIQVPLAERDGYMDEADVFYADPARWVEGNMEGLERIRGFSSEAGGGKGKRPWPEHLVFFEQLEETMREVLEGTAYEECWRGFNTPFHDDWRRQGDVVMWCLR